MNLKFTLESIGLNKFPSFGRVQGKDLIGIDISSNNLKIVNLRFVSNKFEVSNLLSRNILGLSDEDISKVIRASLNELNIKTNDIVDIIPSHLVITKNIEIPSINPQEIKEIIGLQAGRHTPYSREEIIVDYVDIGVYKHSYTKILLIIVARNIIKRQYEILDRAGLKLERVLLAPEGIGWSASRILKLETQESPVALIHIDESFTDFTVVFINKVIFVRNIPIGAQHLTEERERYQARFAEEIKSSLESYQSEDIESNPNSIILTGAIEDIKNLAPLLSDLLHLPIKVISYFRNVSISNEAFNKVTLAKHLSFFGLIACLLGQQDMKINLIPEEVKLRKSFEERGKELIKSGILVMTVFVLIFSILITKIYFSTAYLKKVDAKYTPLNKEAKKLEEDFTKLSLIKSYLSKRGFSLEVLSELYNVVSDDMQVSDIRFDEQGRFTVRGTAESMSIVFSFVEAMEKSKYFKDVKTKYTTKRKEASGDVTDFEIVSILTNKEK